MARRRAPRRLSHDRRPRPARPARFGRRSRPRSGADHLRRRRHPCERGRIPPRLSADSLRPYIGILGVLIGAILSTRRQPHHDLRARRPARRAALRVRRRRMDDDELRRRPDAGRRRLPLSRRHFQRQANPSVRDGAPVRREPARALVAQSHRLPHRAISRRRRRRDLHPAHHRLHRPQSAAAPRSSTASPSTR